MAPEVGLEPTTSRLTAARSTIELLWNPKEMNINKPAIGASNRFVTQTGSAGNKMCSARPAGCALSSRRNSGRVAPHDHKPATAPRNNPARPPPGQNKNSPSVCSRQNSTARCCRIRWLQPTPCESPAKAARLVTWSVFAPAIAAKCGRETTLRSHKCCRCRQRAFDPAI